ncbi:hypothetical protein V7S43_000624 [Phytophthora oleae]|uniref:Uncharacterized protein n=1 Tax=Phytophthora oleae TaxID=2107226 RepID=A0ABD3G897_9STRA
MPRWREKARVEEEEARRQAEAARSTAPSARTRSEKVGAVAQVRIAGPVEGLPVDAANDTATKGATQREEEDETCQQEQEESAEEEADENEEAEEEEDSEAGEDDGSQEGEPARHANSRRGKKRLAAELDDETFVRVPAFKNEHDSW